MDTGEQAPTSGAGDSLSIEQRIGNIFGDKIPERQQPRATQPPPVRPEPVAAHEPDSTPANAASESADQSPSIEETASPSDDGTAPEYVEVELDGRQYQVPPELKEAFIRQADYTRKTQEIAAQRQLVEHQMAQFRAAQVNQEFQASIQPQLQELAQIDAQLAQYAKLDWRAVDPNDRTLHMLEMNNLEKLRAAKAQELNVKQQEHSQKAQETLKKLQADAHGVLKSRIPGWSESTAKETRDWALSNGFTSEEVSSIYDPRHAEVLWKAAQYDKARANAKPAVVQAKAVRPTSANPMPQQVKDKLNFRKVVSKTAPNSPERKQAVEARIGAMFQKR